LGGITWDHEFTVASISITGGYNADMNLPPDGTLTDNGTLNEDAKSTLFMNYSDSVFVVKGGGTLTNFTFDGPGGLFELAAGTLKIAGNNPVLYQENIGVNVDIDSVATLNDQGWNVVAFTADNLTVNVNGEMDVFYGAGGGGLLLDSGTNMHNYINVAGGILYYGGSGGVTDTFNRMPVSVNSGGTFQVQSAAGQANKGQLIVTGFNLNTDNASVYMTGSASSIKLANDVRLQTNNGYVQYSGSLKTTDNSNCLLKVGPTEKGTADVLGGTIWINQGDTGYGQLTVFAGTLNFNGQLVVAIDATNQANEDRLTVAGTTDLQAKSTLEVFVNNAPPVNQGWKWPIISVTGGNALQTPVPNFQMPMTTIPNTPALGNSGDPIITNWDVTT
jgi:hypothetical protein